MLAAAERVAVSTTILQVGTAVILRIDSLG